MIRQTKAWLYKLLTGLDITGAEPPLHLSPQQKNLHSSAHKNWETWLPVNLQERNWQLKSACIDGRYVSISLLCCLGCVGQIFSFSFTQGIGLWWSFAFIVYFPVLGFNGNRSVTAIPPSIQCSAHSDNKGHIQHTET